MAAQFGLVAFGPAGWVACAAITIVLIAGASGVFDQSEVNDDDYDDDGIYIPPYVPYNPNQIPDVNPDENEYPEPEITVDPDKDKDADKLQYALPFGYVCVYMSQPQGNNYDPDIDDLRPPSSSFTVGAEAYDSNIGYIIAAIMAGILSYWLVRTYMEERQ